MSEADYADLITAAHRTLDAPLIVVWDNLNTHRSRRMCAFTEAREDWLTVVLRQIQRRPDLINAFLGQTGLTPRTTAAIDPGLSTSVSGCRRLGTGGDHAVDRERGGARRSPDGLTRTRVGGTLRERRGS